VKKTDIQFSRLLCCPSQITRCLGRVDLNVSIVRCPPEPRETTDHMTISKVKIRFSYENPSRRQRNGLICSNPIDDTKLQMKDIAKQSRLDQPVENEQIDRGCPCDDHIQRTIPHCYCPVPYAIIISGEFEPSYGVDRRTFARVRLCLPEFWSSQFHGDAKTKAFVQMHIVVHSTIRLEPFPDVEGMCVHVCRETIQANDRNRV
jgi:hypothetical protein